MIQILSLKEHDTFLKIRIVDREEFDDIYNDETMTHEEKWSWLLEYQHANSDTMLLRPEQIHALTDAPIIGMGVGIDDDGELETYPDSRIYWFPNYMIKDELMFLSENGFINFEKAE